MSDLGCLSGITPKAIENLAKLNIHSIYDLLFHLPLRYIDRTQISSIADIEFNREVQVIGHVYNATVVYGRRRMMTATLVDDTGELSLRFFHFSQYQLKALSDGSRLLCFGEPRRSKNRVEMIHPQYRVLEEHEEIHLSDRLEPVYPTTKGLQQKRLQKFIHSALVWAKKNHPDFVDVTQGVPPDDKKSLWQNETPMLTMLKEVHMPHVDTDKQTLIQRKHPAQIRLAFDELLAHHLSVMKIRILADRRHGHRLLANHRLVAPFISNLGFELTGAQKKVLEEIKKDIDSNTPMMRLVQGDVGSGKTVIAIVACLYAVENDCQAAVMAPTELLAEQHYHYFSRHLLPLGIQVAWLSSGLSAGKKKKMLELIATGSAAVVVGTHALFQDEVVFKNLALCVTDEQHRFGVQQRLLLSQKGLLGDVFPHQLSMTATPIPRTLAMSMYAHLDYSVIDELPPGRKPITTVAIADTRRDEVVSRIKLACSNGAQAYWVCSLIEESDTLQSQAASETYAHLTRELGALKVGMLHGRMKSQEKDHVMKSFINNQLDVLVATTVIEVGVDVPNASLMIIENAERFGLAQLHQLRGRVGRGEKQSCCLLLYKSPLGEVAKKRIDALRHTTDGFELARIDLELRGPGEVLGTRQSGDMQLRIANLSRDMYLLPDVQKTARWLIENHPERIDTIVRRWMGKALDYANA